MKVHRSIRQVRNGWAPGLWASIKPFGVGERHANNFWEVFRAAWENRDKLDYAFRILNEGVCDGRALREKRSRDLRALGRLPYPMVRRRGEPGFRRIPWEEALNLAATRIKASRPEGSAIGDVS